MSFGRTWVLAFYLFHELRAAGGDHNVLEYRSRVGGFMHHRELKAALFAGLGEDSLFAMQIVWLVGGIGAARADANQPGVLQLEIGDDVFHNRPASNCPLACL